MPKDRQPTLIPTTSDHLSRAMETILRRFPKSDRPTKNALLNDLAGAIAPGKNWGGLLAMHRASAASLEVHEERGQNVLQTLWAQGEDHTKASVPVGAIELRIKKPGGALEFDLLQSTTLMRDLATPLNGGTVVGFLAEINVHGYSVGVSPFLSAIVINEGKASLERLYGHDVPSSLCRVGLEVLQSVDLGDLYTYMSEQSIHDASVVISPMLGLCIIPDQAKDSLAAGNAIAPYDIAALRFLLPDFPDDPYVDESLNTLMHLTEIALPGIFKLDKIFRIELDQPHFAAFDWAPIRDDIPSPPWEDRFLSKEAGTQWSEVFRDYSSFRTNMTLAEALAFASDFLRLKLLDPIHILAVTHDSNRPTSSQKISNDWKFITWRDGQVGEWKLSDDLAHHRLRSFIEAWAQSQGISFVSPSELPKGAFSVVVPRERSRNSTHWDRAIKLFKSQG